MQVKILPPARERLIGIWQYTADTWGEEQANEYVSGLISALDKIAAKRDIWRSVKEPRFSGLYFTRYKHHYIFFKVISGNQIGVVSILHENMDLPSRISDDIDEAE